MIYQCTQVEISLYPSTIFTYIKILKLKSLLNRTEGWELSVTDLFRYPTIASLLQFIDRGGNEPAPDQAEIKAEVADMEQLLDVFGQEK